MRGVRWGVFLEGRIRNWALYSLINERTHECRETLDLDFLSDYETATPLLPGRLAHDRDSIFGTSTETIKRCLTRGSRCTRKLIQSSRVSIRGSSQAMCWVG